MSNTDKGTKHDEQDKQQATKDERKPYRMSDVLKQYRGGYKKVNRPSGKSLNCGDTLAAVLVSCDPLEVARVGDIVLDLEPGELADQYGHLNEGQIRMNSGNRIRNAMKRGEVTMVAVKAAVQSIKPTIKEA